MRRLRTPQVWENIPARARVAPGDVLVFAWQPPGWTGSLTVHGLVMSAGVERRSWFIAVDSQVGRQGTWCVRLHRGALIGLPLEPTDEQWWLMNPPSGVVPVRVQQRRRPDGVGGQIPLFDEDVS